ncbi:hypothetical protein RND71_037126 [Anisodus tanguticus]|uniref:Ycf2 N-terminal domain-containing protein n=1 Tax=Anisodus tanguticus TaxID=243964 RepID=A0AAE1UUS1_9SOLA|nr:hypothetical protein RND71_037126 [Anisodus tanguticus]
MALNGLMNDKEPNWLKTDSGDLCLARKEVLELYRWKRSKTDRTRVSGFNEQIKEDIHLIADISGTPLTEGQIVTFERTYCQPLSNLHFFKYPNNLNKVGTSK